MRVLISSILCSTALAAALAARTDSRAWQKPFTDWTAHDAQQIMTDSPWVKKVPMPAAARPGIAVIEPGANGAAPPSASLGNPSNSTSGTNMSNPGVGGTPGPADQNGQRLPNSRTPSNVSENLPAPEPGAPISIIWASAAPVRLAVLKLQSGVNTPTSGEIDRVTKPRDNYVIAVAGLAPPDRDTDLNSLAQKASLGVRGKHTVAVTCTYRRIGNTDVYFFRFPRTNLPIADTDRQADFKAVFGQAEIKHRFDLKNMQYQGQLAL